MENRPKCPICGKDFKKRSGLAGHMAIVHGQKLGAAEQKETKDQGKKAGCRHEWTRLNEVELFLVNDEGRTIRELGYKYRCKKCGDLR